MLRSGLELETLKGVKHVPAIVKNLVFGSLLCDAGMRLNFQGGKAILSYKNIYFGNAYLTEVMYMINIVNSVLVIHKVSIVVYSFSL